MVHIFISKLIMSFRKSICVLLYYKGESFNFLNEKFKLLITLFINVSVRLFFFLSFHFSKTPQQDLPIITTSRYVITKFNTIAVTSCWIHLYNPHLSVLNGADDESNLETGHFGPIPR